MVSARADCKSSKYSRFYVKFNVMSTNMYIKKTLYVTQHVLTGELGRYSEARLEGTTLYF